LIEHAELIAVFMTPNATITMDLFPTNDQSGMKLDSPKYNPAAEADAKALQEL
jgi:hypothetical protein